VPGVQKNTSFPSSSKIRRPSGFCGMFNVPTSKSDLAFTLAPSRSDAMCVWSLEELVERTSN
jgi:hypothetical protein